MMIRMTNIAVYYELVLNARLADLPLANLAASISRLQLDIVRFFERKVLKSILFWHITAIHCTLRLSSGWQQITIIYHCLIKSSKENKQ